MKITVIGAAGTMGSCATFNILSHKMATEMILIDPWKEMLMSHWLDFSTAVNCQDTRVNIGEYPDMKGSNIVVVAAGSAGGQLSSRRELLPANLPVIKEVAENISRYCPEAFVITATNPVDPLNYAMYLLSGSKDRRKIIGYSLNDSFRFRMLAARVMGVNASHLDGMVIGEHDHSQVLLYSTLRLNSKPVQVDEDFKKQVQKELDKTWKDMEIYKKRTSGWTSAVGIVAIIHSIINDSGKIIPCNMVQEGEYGYRGLSMTVPVEVGKEGMRSIKKLELAPDEQEGLKTSVNVMHPLMHIVEDFVGKK